MHLTNRFPATLSRLAIVLALAIACGRGGDVPVADLEPVEHPDLAAVEDVARRQLGEAQQALDAELARRSDRRRLADAFGNMGELYHAYELLPTAAACYRNARVLDPESFLWSYYLGALYQALGDVTAAADSLDRALALRGDDAPAQLRRGEARLAAGELAAAEGDFQVLLGRDGFAAAAHYGLGRAAVQAEKAGAVEHFETALELQPGAGIVHHPLGLALRQLGRAEGALAHLETKAAGEVSFPDRLMERVEARAVSSGAHLRRGNRALVAGRLDEAVEAFRAAVEANPGSSDAHRNLALALMRAEDVDGAVQQLKTALEQAPENVWLHFDLGNAYFSKGQSEQAVRAFRRAVELADDFTSGHFNLANALISLERWREALPHLERALELDPEDRRARYLSGMAQHHTGATEDAITALRLLLREEPADTVARQGLATVMVAAGRPGQAMAVYRQGLELDIPAAEKVALLDALARLSWQRRRRPEAIEHWRQATELAPDSSKAFVDLANALQLSGKEEEARGHFARAVELDPSNATAWLSETRLWIRGGEYRIARDRLAEALEHVPGDVALKHSLARLLATCPIAELRNGALALTLAREAFTLEQTLDHAETVGMALAEMGLFEQAIQWQRRFLQQAMGRGDQAAARRLMGNLSRYEKLQPVRIEAGGNPPRPRS